jgi:hypothetical protein
MVLELNMLLKLDQLQKTILRTTKLLEIKKEVENKLPHTPIKSLQAFKKEQIQEIYDFLQLSQYDSKSDLKLAQIEILGLVAQRPYN